MTARALVLTMGDPAGIGPEITIKAWSALRRRGPAFAVCAPAGVISQTAADLGAPAPEIIAAPEEAASVFPERLPILDADAPSPGAEQRAVIASIKTAVSFALNGQAAGVVTNPVSKSALYAQNFKFPGHTEFIAHLTKDAPVTGPRGPAMMLAGPALRTAPATIHLSLRDAIAALTIERIVSTARIVHHALIRDFGLNAPRLAVAGLNPHAGENGALGREDMEIVAPAVEQLKTSGVNAAGPHPSDTMFHADARARYDAAICMYHDQALIPVKTLNFHEAVNATLGLPVVRTSPDHGVAYDIAGRGIARADSLIAAIRLASEMAENRARAEI